MTNKHTDSTEDANFTVAWIMIGFFSLLQLSYLIMAYWIPEVLQENHWTESEREFTRSIFYVIAIITFPMTSIIRHIQRRLIQTIPKSKSLTSRYLKMVFISQVLMASIGGFGFILFIFGDQINNLYIFTALAFLGFFIHRPKENEYHALKSPL